MLVRSTQTLDSLYAHYSAPALVCCGENSSFSDGRLYRYLSGFRGTGRTVPIYSYLWPYSGTFSAVNALMEATKDNKKDFGNYRSCLMRRFSGLAEYFDTRRMPEAYAFTSRTLRCPTAFTMTTWLGIDFTDVYLMTSQENYLQSAVYLEVYRKRYGRLFGRRYLFANRRRNQRTLVPTPWFRLCPETFWLRKTALF